MENSRKTDKIAPASWGAVAGRSGDTALRAAVCVRRRRGAPLPAAVQNLAEFVPVMNPCPSVFIRGLIDMSLKAFHLIFVTLLTALSFGCAAWGFAENRPLFGALGVTAGILVIIYGIYFLKKLKKISYL